MPLDKNIKDKFNNADLKNEDWLELPDEIFDNISDVIYPKNDRENRILLLIIFCSTIILTGIGIYFLGNTTFLESQLNIFSTPNNKTSAATSLDNGSDKKSSSSTIQIIDKKSSPISTHNKDIKDLIAENNSVQKLSSHSNYNLIENRIKKKEIASSVNEITSSAIDTKITLKDKNLIGYKKPNNIDVNQVPTISNLLETPAFVLNLFKDLEQINTYETLKNEEYKWSIDLHYGYSNWNFKLNDNFSSALEPASFEHKNGHGQVFNLGFNKKLNHKINIGFTLGYENIKLLSGHNSMVIYDRQLENNNSNANTYNITMASPIGFISSDIVLQRISESIEETQTVDLTLKNSHNIYQYNIDINSNYNIFKYKRFNFYSGIGIGFSHTKSVKNNLDNYYTSNNSLSSGTSKITGNQENLKRNRFNFFGTISILREFNKNYAIGLSYRLKKEFNPIFKLEDNSTNVLIHQSSVFIRKSF